MKTKEIIKTLKKANEWRRGANIEMPDVTKFGIAIDEAVNRLKTYEEQIKSIDKTTYKLFKQLNLSDEMVNSAVGELQFANLQKDYYKSILDEVEVLLKKEVKNNLIKKVIDNGKERGYLDMLIHTDLLFKGSKGFNN